MSEPQTISPLPEGFALGEAIGSRPGVTCCQAQRADSDERYIVKTICVPSSQTQLEALLLTGAYPDADAAKSYFRELAEGLEQEACVLDKLSAQRGFFNFSGFRIAEMTGGVGYSVTLIAPHRRSLEELLRSEPMTRRGAVNMAIDLCAALATCREAGCLYVDLKPSNVFLSPEGDFRIGDLGFEKLTGLKYASLPDRCRSAWTAPEIRDAYSSLNTTIDIYALGLILYQAYNHGRLPWKNEAGRQSLLNQLAQGGLMTAPANADFDLNQIIQKACAYDPAQRWQTPLQMAQALIAYLNQNDPTDEIIAPLLPDEPEEEAAVEEDAPAEEPIPEAAPAEEALVEEEPKAEPAEEEPEEQTAEETPIGEAPEEPINEEPEEAPPMEEEPGGGEDLPEEEDWLKQMDAILAQDGEGGRPLPSLRELLGDFTLPEDEEEPDTDRMLSQIDDLIEQESPAATPEPAAPVAVEQPAPQEKPEPARKKRGFVGLIAAIALLCLLAAGIYYAYNEYILQTIHSLHVEGVGDVLTVTVDTDMDESRLTVVCVDQYGTKLTAPLENGQAAFTGLMADTQYTITLEAEGFCVLTGETTTHFYTPMETSVTGFSAVTGPEDGSALLTFNTTGPDSASWTLEYSATGVEPGRVSFSGHMHTVTGLTPGLEYTFRLSANDDLRLTGQTQLTFTANSLVYAQHLTLAGNADGSITASWTAPADVTVGAWTARCYNDAGFDQTLTVTEPTATFNDIDPQASYTVEVVAEGMTQCTRTYVTANPITVTNVQTEPFGEDSLLVTWTYEGTSPAGGWLLLYTVDRGSEQHVIQCPEASAVISPVVPGGHYDLTIQAAGAVSVFGGTGSADIPEAQVFDYFDMDAAAVTMALAKAPAEDWTWKDRAEADRTTSFAAGEKIAVLLATEQEIGQSDSSVTTMFVFRNDAGRVAQIFEVTKTWNEMWTDGHCGLTITQTPLTPGEYTLQVYIDGKLLSNQNVTFA